MMARNYAVVLPTAMLAFWSSSAAAEPVVLKCWSSSGAQTADWTLDIDSRKLKFGAVDFEITALTDSYITGFYRGFRVGGEVLVLNRATGEYMRASVAMLCTDDKCGSTVLSQSLYTGKCQRQQF